MLVNLGTQAWHKHGMMRHGWKHRICKKARKKNHDFASHGEYLFRENWFLMLNLVKATQKVLAFGKQTWLAGKSYMFFFLCWEHHRIYLGHFPGSHVKMIDGSFWARVSICALSKWKVWGTSASFQYVSIQDILQDIPMLGVNAFRFNFSLKPFKSSDFNFHPQWCDFQNSL